jgi:hypothetical protein
VGKVRERERERELPPLPIFSLLRECNASNKENNACVILIKLFINSVFISEFLADICRASFSLVYPASEPST